MGCKSSQMTRCQLLAGVFQDTFRAYPTMTLKTLKQLTDNVKEDAPRRQDIGYHVEQRTHAGSGEAEVTFVR